LIESPTTEKDRASNKYEPRKETYNFSCSGQKCPALLEIGISGPRLPKSLLGLINDKKILGFRGRRELDKDPIRYEGQQPSTPANAYWYLRSYLSDAKGATDPAQLKKIAKRNKKYKVTFDDECDELFEHLGFVSVNELAQIPEVSWALEPLFISSIK
jgi:ubiquitin carboxyl-terminal hydrolase 25/28